jgi:hypothetical protein
MHRIRVPRKKKTALEDERGFDPDDGSDECRLRAP